MKVVVRRRYGVAASSKVKDLSSLAFGFSKLIWDLVSSGMSVLRQRGWRRCPVRRCYAQTTQSFGNWVRWGGFFG
ncbi:hypothetical protein KY285_024560 [Solanum tuberosum]|nr:hypothetical protein KY285_024560 [Solanum tuberosum]